MDALSTQDDKVPDELAGAWDEFVRDPKHGREVAFFVELAETGAQGKGRLAYGVLIQLANRRFSSRETNAEATRVIEKAWAAPASAVQLLYAIAQLRADQYAHQVRALAGDPRPGLSKAAAFAADRLGLKAEPGPTAGQPLIESLPYDQVVTAAAKEPGEPKAGRELFLKQGCVACHTVSATEPLKGPFLGGIAARYNRSELCESILKPGAKVAQGFETQWFTTRDGDEIEGFVVREAGDEIEVRNVQGISTTLTRPSIKERGRRETSAMPIGLADKLTPSQLASLLAYLESLPAQ
jgi:putative heme-binding domain-containing protein